MQVVSYFRIIVWLVLSLGLGAGAAVAEPFKSLEDYLNEQGNTLKIREFHANVTGLNRQFDFLCPDTFCEGDFGNLTPIDFVCAIDVATAKVAQCSWIFTGSVSVVDASSGNVNTLVRGFECRFEPDAGVPEFLAFMDTVGYHPVEYASYDNFHRTPIPGTTRTLWDVLVRCL